MREIDGIPYSIIRCRRRRTLGIVVNPDGEVEVRIPAWVTIACAEAFVRERYDWIVRSRKKMLDRKERQAVHDWEKVKEETGPWIKGKGGELFRQKVDYWADRLGVTYNRLTLRDTSTRWGSCSAKGNLSFSWKVFVMPERLVDYLIVHELSHRRYMNHSQQFWDMVETYIPERKKIKKEFEEYV